MTRVAALVATEIISGPGRQLAALRAPLRDRHVELEVLLLQRGTGGPPPYAGYLERTGVPYHLIRDRGPLDWRMVGAVRGHLEAMGAEVVQTHGYKATALGFVLKHAAPGAQRPWVGFYHGATDKDWRDRAYQWLELRMLRSADRIVVVSREQATRFPHPDRVRIIPNAAIDLPATIDGVGASLPPESLPGSPGPRLGVVGRLSPEKGVDVFLHACAELRRRERAFSAVIVGDGPEQESLHRLVKELELADQVRFLGRIDRVEAVYAALDLLVLPSRSEGLPNVLLEGLRADVPVVATAVGAVPDVLTDPMAGRLAPPGDPMALADAMLQALEQCTGPGGSAARQGILGRFDLGSRVRDHVALYGELLSPGEPDRRGAQGRTASVGPGAPRG